MTKPKSALVVEDDESTREVLSDYLKQMGIEVIRAAANGQSAKKAMAKRLFDIIITDWKMTDGSGLALVNAIQTNNECLYQAILVCSGYLEPNDFSFLREFPCVDYLVKPVGYSQVRQGVVRVFEKSTWFRSRSTEVETAIGRLTTHRKESITELKSLLKDVPDQASFAFIIGKRLLTIGDYAHAEPFLRKASILEPDNGYFANNFARSLAGQGRHEEVLEILKDTRFSQQHFDRFFLMGEASLHNLKASDAQRFFSKALKIDPHSKEAANGQSVSISIRQFQTTNPLASAQKDCASMFNNIGVSYAQRGSPEKAIDFYENALKFIKDEKNAHQVRFNLGLSYLRIGEKAKAQKNFKKVAASGHAIAKKARKYI